LKNDNEKVSKDKGKKKNDNNDGNDDFLLVEEFASTNLVDNSTNWMIDSSLFMSNSKESFLFPILLVILTT